MNKKNSGGGGSDGAGKKSAKEASIDEVEELLKLTQDDLLLKLTVNSHLTSKPKSKPNSNFIPDSSSSSSNIDTDLDRRFQALRSKKPEPQNVDDLFTRFAALKGGANAPPAVDFDYEIGDDDNDEEDEVQKIINWAVDAARLDPSPSSDIDENDDSEKDSDFDSDDDDDDDDDEVVRKVDCKKKGSKKFDVASKVDCKKKGSKK